MEKKTSRSINIAVFKPRSFDGCKTILRLFVHYSLIGVLIVSTGCNPSSTTVNYNQTAQPDGDTSQRETILMGGGGGGTGDGGGGQGVYCSDTVSDKNLKGKLLVRDIYEAIKNHNRSMPSSKLGGAGTVEVDDTAINHLVGVLKNYFGPASVNLNYVNAEYWKKFAKSIAFIAEDAAIHPSQDANSPLALPKGCAMVQIAYWDESSGPIDDGTLWVDKKRWIQLDQFNKIALLAHEFFFKQARKAGFKNSDFVRHKVGQLLSEIGLPSLFQSWVPSKDGKVSDSLPENRKGFKFCEGTSKNDPTAKLHMYQYKGSDNLQHIVFPLIRSSTLNFSEFQTPHVRFSENDNKNISLITNTLTLATYLANNSIGNDLLLDYDLSLSTLANYRYTQSDLLLSENESLLSDRSEKKFRNLSTTEYADAKWTIPTQIHSKGVTITLHNPFNKSNDAIKTPIAKSREDLILTLNNWLSFTLQSNFPSITEDELLSSFSILNNEINQMTSFDKFDKNFPRWTSELHRLYKNSQQIIPTDIGSSEKSEITYNDYQKIKTEFPVTLYKIKMNIYDEKDLVYSGLNPYLTPSPFQNFIKSIGEGTISFQNGEEQSTFTLHCKDYIDIYRDRTNQTTQKKQNIFSLKNSNLFMREKTIIHSDIDKKSFGDDNEGYSLAEKFISSLPSNFYKSQLAVQLKQFASSGFQAVQSDLNSFLVDLETEQNLNISACDKYPPFTRDSSKDIYSCVVIKNKKTENKYLVLLSAKNLSDKPMEESSKNDLYYGDIIQYILRIP